VGTSRPKIASPRYQLLGRSGSAGTGTAVAASATADTKGSYVTIGTTSYAYDGFKLTNGRSGVGSTGVAYRIDLATDDGLGGGPQIIMQDMFYEGSTLWYLQALSPIEIPVRIPSGVDLKMRCQSSAGGDWVYPSIQGVSADNSRVRGYTKLLPATDWTGTAPNNSGFNPGGATQTGWVTVCASTSDLFAGLYVGLALRGAGGSTYLDFMIDVAIGSVGNEQYLFTVHGYDDSNNGSPSAMLGCPAGPYDCDIPAGSRIAMRFQGSFASATGVLYPTAFGLVL
jgi:hypothetical protein